MSASMRVEHVPAASVPSRTGVEVLLLRHAATGWNDQHRRLGWADQPLTAAGREAAAAWAAHASVELSGACCSDLQRARATAQIIAAVLGLGEVRELPGLREQDQGAWTGLTKEQIKLRWPERLRERPRRPVGGETAEAVVKRALAALDQLAARYDGQRVVAVTHSHVIRALERAMGVQSPPVAHLQGRWLTIAARAESSTQPAIERLLAGEATAGRRAPAATADCPGGTRR